ncbi:MAG: DUF4199 domain-containing protein [Pedobacter sp.]|nr:MAG: DUF4199 domain-containing protein [Pedobacter sp.]
MENSKQPKLGPQILKNGLIWGAINIVIFLVAWYTMPEALGETWYQLISIVIGILLAVYFCKDLRTHAGGYWSFSQALWPIFGMFILSAGILFTFNIIFGKYIDTTYPVKMKEMVMERSLAMYEKFGMDESMIEKSMMAVEESIDAQVSPTVPQAIKGFGIVAIIYFIGALIFAAIFKRSDPNPWKEELEAENNPQV